VSLWQYRYTASAMGQQEERTPQPWCCCYHFVADDTVITYFIYGFIIKKEVMELKMAISYCYGTNYLGK
jgi:hypothetical protein